MRFGWLVGWVPSCSRSGSIRFTNCFYERLSAVSAEKKCLNSELWHACAGPLVCLPTVGTRVVYFPQGHSEQVSSGLAPWCRSTTWRRPDECKVLVVLPRRVAALGRLL